MLLQDRSEEDSIHRQRVVPCTNSERSVEKYVETIFRIGCMLAVQRLDSILLPRLFRESRAGLTL